jgi:hypothetical protein
MGAAASTVTGRGLSFSAQNKPASPPAADDDIVDPGPGDGRIDAHGRGLSP